MPSMVIACPRLFSGSSSSSTSPSFSTLLFVLLFTSILIVHQSSAAASERLCGLRLTKAMYAICRGQFCGGFLGHAIGKRSTTTKLIGLHSSVKRSGIATECCERRCSFAYMQSFCCFDQEDLGV